MTFTARERAVQQFGMTCVNHAVVVEGVATRC